MLVHQKMIKRVLVEINHIGFKVFHITKELEKKIKHASPKSWFLSEWDYDQIDCISKATNMK